MKCYGCCRCQTEHMEDSPLFDAHIMWQSKHGIYDVSVETAILAAMATLKWKEEARKMSEAK